LRKLEDDEVCGGEWCRWREDGPPICTLSSFLLPSASRVRKKIKKKKKIKKIESLKKSLEYLKEYSV
jgi:hypothetical protein